MPNGKGKGKAPALRAGQQKAPKPVGHGAFKRNPGEKKTTKLSANSAPQPKGNPPTTKKSPPPKKKSPPTTKKSPPPRPTGAKGFGADTMRQIKKK